MRDPNRVYWNEKFKILQDTWPKTDNFVSCIEICLVLHGMVHSGNIAVHSMYWSFEDELWSKCDEEIFRKVIKDDQSIAWKLWHSARIEDMTMNVLVANGQQVFISGDWSKRLNIKAVDTGNAMNTAEIEDLSKSVCFETLKKYRSEVGKRTTEIIKTLMPEDLKKKVPASSLQRLLDEGAVVPQAKGLLDYWGKKTFSGLLLMPATRHIFVHLNESLRIVEKSKKNL